MTYFPRHGGAAWNQLQRHGGPGVDEATRARRGRYLQRGGRIPAHRPSQGFPQSVLKAGTY